MAPPPKIRSSAYLTEEQFARVEQYRIREDLPSQSAAETKLIEHALDTLVPRVARKDRIAYMLRDQKGPREAALGGGLDYDHADDWEQGGGRWLLNWLLLREPDWQRHHTVLFPRHWPLQLAQREHRCLDNGGSSRSVMDHIREYIDTDCPPECRFPSDFETLTEGEWQEICDRFRGCCGERLRDPFAPHWDAICDPAAS